MFFNVVDIITGELNSFFSHSYLIGVLFLFFIGATYTDIKSLKIYNKFNLAFLITRIVFIFIPVYGLSLSFSHIFGALIGFTVLIIPAVALMHKMGGDIKFITILGLYLGTPLMILLLLISCITMLIFSFIKKLITKDEVKKTLVPFAPFFTISFSIMFIISLLI